MNAERILEHFARIAAAADNFFRLFAKAGRPGQGGGR